MALAKTGAAAKPTLTLGLQPHSTSRWSPSMLSHCWRHCCLKTGAENTRGQHQMGLDWLLSPIRQRFLITWTVNKKSDRFSQTARWPKEAMRMHGARHARWQGWRLRRSARHRCALRRQRRNRVAVGWLDRHETHPGPQRPPRNCCPDCDAPSTPLPVQGSKGIAKKEIPPPDGPTVFCPASRAC